MSVLYEHDDVGREVSGTLLWVVTAVPPWNAPAELAELSDEVGLIVVPGIRSDLPERNPRVAHELTQCVLEAEDPGTVFGGKPSPRAKSRSTWRGEHSASFASSLTGARPALTASAVSARRSSRGRIEPQPPEEELVEQSRAPLSVTGRPKSRLQLPRRVAEDDLRRRGLPAEIREAYGRERRHSSQLKSNSDDPDRAALEYPDRHEALRVEIGPSVLGTDAADHQRVDRERRS